MMTECSECPAGTYADVLGSSSCTECPAGSFQKATGATGCIACPAHASSTVGSVVCLCDSGYSGDGTSSCKACTPGKYRGSVECSGTCPCGSHGPSSGSFSDGPGNYVSSQTCSWLVASDYPTNIMIAFSSFNTESGRDYVTITECSSADCNRQGSRELARLSGSAVSASTVYTSSTGFLEVVFRTDYSDTVTATYAGFEAAWTLGSIKTIMMTKCLECPAGAYTNASGSSSCTKCTTGYFQKATGATGCVTCDCGEKEFSGDSYSCGDYCERKEELEKRKATEISAYSVSLVVVGIICELFTAISICKWALRVGDESTSTHQTRSTSKYKCIILILFLADIGFSVGKLFPELWFCVYDGGGFFGTGHKCYNCDTWSCRKIAHVCTMTLCSFLFQLVEVYILRTMSRDQGIRVPTLVKLVEYSASLSFVLYDAATQDPPGVGTTVLIVCASLAEVLLLAIEAHTFWTFRRPEDAVGPLLAQVQLGKYDKVQRLLQNGADVNAANSCTPPPLGLQPARAPMCSLCSCRQTCVRVCTDARTPALCSRGAGADHRDQEGAPGPG